MKISVFYALLALVPGFASAQVMKKEDALKAVEALKYVLTPTRDADPQLKAAVKAFRDFGGEFSDISVQKLHAGMGATRTTIRLKVTQALDGGTGGSAAAVFSVGVLFVGVHERVVSDAVLKTYDASWMPLPHGLGVRDAEPEIEPAIAINKLEVLEALNGLAAVLATRPQEDPAKKIKPATDRFKKAGAEILDLNVDSRRAGRQNRHIIDISVGNHVGLMGKTIFTGVFRIVRTENPLGGDRAHNYSYSTSFESPRNCGLTP